MPETILKLKWPDQQIEEIYSPSTIIMNYFTEGDELNLEEFGIKSRKAFQHASDRVELVHGFACTSALSSLSGIQNRINEFEDKESKVVILEMS